MGKSAASVVDMETRIVSIRGLSVLLQAVRRNPERFPSDFMFQLSNQELGILRSQTVTSKRSDGRGGRRTLPYAFTEQGGRSPGPPRPPGHGDMRLVRLGAPVSDEIMRIVEDLSNRVDSHDQVIGDIVESIRQLAALPPRERSRPIGFTADLDSDSS
ncbi:MAG: ORF6N domain-containing protein [Proteobacteria bacterium]|nr:ORF6N domain-containing protein [Pseudomonadota bacterium]